MPLPGTELSCALYGFESLFLAHGASRHAYLGTRRVSWVSLAPLWRYAGANAAILVKKWCKKQNKKRKTSFSTTFSPKWPRLRPRSATTAQVRPTTLAVVRDMHVDRRRARGIRIRGRTARTTARCQGAGRKTPIGTMVGKRGRRSASNFGDFDDFGANFVNFFQHHHPQQTSTTCRGCEVEH